jgi:hypothetical protein
MLAAQVILGLYELRNIKIVTGARATFALLAAWLLISGFALALYLLQYLQCPYVAGGRKRCSGCLSSQPQAPSGAQVFQTLIDLNGSRALH